MSLAIQHTDHLVCTRLGQPIKSFNDRKRAVAFAQENAGAFPGCYVERVEYVEPIRTRLWRDRSHLRLVGAA